MTDAQKIRTIYEWPSLHDDWSHLTRAEKQYVLDAMDANSSRAWIELAISDAKIELEENTNVTN